MTRTTVPCVVLLAVLAISPAALCQGAAEPRFDVRNLTVSNGLSQDSVTFLLQDRKGFVWRGTNDGLNRYDDHSIRDFRHDSSVKDSLPVGPIRSVLEDREGTLWVVTDDGFGTLDRTTGRFTRVAAGGTEVTQIAGSLYEDRAGRLWVATRSGSPGLLDRETLRVTPVPLPRMARAEPGSLVRLAFAEDSRRNLWIGALTGVFRVPPGGGPPSEEGVPGLLRGQSVHALSKGVSDELWMATSKGLVRANLVTAFSGSILSPAPSRTWDLDRRDSPMVRSEG